MSSIFLNNVKHILSSPCLDLKPQFYSLMVSSMHNAMLDISGFSYVRFGILVIVYKF